MRSDIIAEEHVMRDSQGLQEQSSVLCGNMRIMKFILQQM